MKRNIAVLATLAATLLVGASNAHAADPQPLRVMSYNIRLDLASDGPNAWPHRRDWVVAQIDWLHPDLFGLQEVLPNQKADIVAGLPRYRLYGGGRDDGRERGEAVPVGFDISRFEFVEGGLFWLSPTPSVPSKGWDAALNRIATWVRLRVRGTPHAILAVNTHWDHIGEVARRESAAQIASWLSANSKRCEHVVLLGDFNTVLESEPLRILARDSGLRDARSASRTPPFGPAWTFTGFVTANPAERRIIDHVWVGKDVTVERYVVLSQLIDGRWPSDHFPVIVDVRMPECARRYSRTSTVSRTLRGSP